MVRHNIPPPIRRDYNVRLSTSWDRFPIIFDNRMIKEMSSRLPSPFILIITFPLNCHADAVGYPCICQFTKHVTARGFCVAEFAHTVLSIMHFFPCLTGIYYPSINRYGFIIRPNPKKKNKNQERSNSTHAIFSSVTAIASKIMYSSRGYCG